MRKLSEILKEMDKLQVQYEIIDSTCEDSEEKEDQLTMISLAMDCLDTCLMYGDYENDTGKEFNYEEYYDVKYMIQLISRILEQAIQSNKSYDIDYNDLAESILNLISNIDEDKEYYRLIDEIQILIMRKGCCFLTFIECEEVYNKVMKNIGAYI